jgi:hypothetical protein
LYLLLQNGRSKTFLAWDREDGFHKRMHARRLRTDRGSGNAL